MWYFEMDKVCLQLCMGIPDNAGKGRYCEPLFYDFHEACAVIQNTFYHDGGQPDRMVRLSSIMIK